ncbi:VOC family protein [Streptomyces spectabilis]|uniref:Putative enzyme related to lactoylglutathione lyase n=1 Tax=Streptomyces spectabilis TaxID=68270 RepID=A0A5P2X0V0_STRST|nr:VOC family protein [Streptomyces spectabilis]MBB5101227.1 putative enzyme related to lactoylglutathione lyase [Streptomyces spectabilis]MCI3900428.1 VOC family protein [Streptomyces spectabilis]QEV58008.1 VOC family protein [Streptomyces spectabilis]GGV10124.1 glyoxalase [Streptomyces spectabilis]
MTSTDTTGTPLAGKIICQALWAEDGRRLADFYAAALGTEVSATFPDEHGTDVAFAFYVGEAMHLFYTSASFTAPNWPEDPLPFHMDLVFDDARAAEERLLELGATKPDFQPGGEHWTVLFDPSGQPFCVHGAR